MSHIEVHEWRPKKEGPSDGQTLSNAVHSHISLRWGGPASATIMALF
jgi:hypothetical protein